MSYVTLFGAYAAPAGGGHPVDSPAADAPGFRGASRSGAFHAACAALLEALPGHEALGFLAAQRPGREEHTPDGRTTTDLIEPPAIAAVAARLDALLAACSARPDAAHAALQDPLGSCDRAAFVAALASASACTDLNAESPSGEDGDSPAFFCNALRSLQALLQQASRQGRAVVYYNWLPR